MSALIRKRASLLGIFFLALSVGAAADKNAGTSGAAFLKIGEGARPAALGEAVTAVIDDVNAVAWNPAGLSRVTSPQFTAAQAQWVQDYSHSFVAAAYPFSWGVVGLGFTSLSVSGIERRTTDVNDAEGTFGSDDSSYRLSYGTSLGEAWALGVTANYIRQVLDGHSAAAVAGDLGFQWRPEAHPFSLGLSARHLGSKVKFDQVGDPLPSVISLGFGYRLMNDRLRFSADVRRPQHDALSYGAGLELARPLPWKDMSAALRGGYNTASTDASSGIGGVTAGLGLTWRNWGFDAAWAPYGNLGQVLRYALLVKF